MSRRAVIYKIAFTNGVQGHVTIFDGFAVFTCNSADFLKKLYELEKQKDTEDRQTELNLQKKSIVQKYKNKKLEEIAKIIQAEVKKNARKL